MHWPRRTLEPLAIAVGPCAWSADGLNDRTLGHVAARPSLIYIDTGPAADAGSTPALAPALRALPRREFPIALALPEPVFVRRFADEVRRRLERLALDHAHALLIHVTEPTDLKAGGLIQEVSRLREAGAVGALGFVAPTALVAEWLALHTAGRLLVLPHSLDDQLVRHRAIPAAIEHGMAVLAAVTDSPPTAQGLSFALGCSPLPLPILRPPLDERVPPMNPDHLAEHWRSYSARRPAPPPLPRSGPPDAAG